MVVVDQEEQPVRRSALKEAAQAAAAQLRPAPRRSCSAVPGRVQETISQLVREDLADHGSPYKDRVAAYRGGYLPEERRELEEGLRSGDIRALATTNALELGIDISGLDTVVMSGWPGTHASFRQQMGRAGRASRMGLPFLLRATILFDQYLAENVAGLLEQPVEAQVFDPSNPYILSGHVCAAASRASADRRRRSDLRIPDNGTLR